MEEIIPDIKSRFPDLDIPSIRDISGDNNNNSDNTPPPNNSKLDKFEPNDTFSQSVQVRQNLDINGLNLHDANDIDLYKLEIRKESNVQVLTEFTHNLGDIDIAVYAKNGTTLIKASQSE